MLASLVSAAQVMHVQGKVDCNMQLWQASWTDQTGHPNDTLATKMPSMLSLYLVDKQTRSPGCVDYGWCAAVQVAEGVPFGLSQLTLIVWLPKPDVAWSKHWQWGYQVQLHSVLDEGHLCGRRLCV